ncbi:rod-binding protein [Jannaschia sp. 2305UL9-9]|uniref:rod-binding protein n=1 Tax=Jannaschia sp. 2305UL9-9 TaxID=3121638 RepID=UPI0035279032
MNISQASAFKPVAPPPDDTPREAALREQATKLEGLMFAQLLQAADTGKSSPLGGAPSQFDSFLRQTQADAVAGSGQTGLAEAIYRSMRRTLG